VFIGVNRAISAPNNNIHTYKIIKMAKYSFRVYKPY
jgi:hypothetical protein